MFYEDEVLQPAACAVVLGYVYVGAALGDKSELPFENHGTSFLSLILAPT
jgi:hypothetical protein